MAHLTYPLYLFFGILPSIVWLLYYLRKDVHPEPKRMVLMIFFCGMLSAAFAVAMEIGFLKILSEGFLENNLTSKLLISGLNVFIGVALIEEVSKYLVVRIMVVKSPEFDEAIDTMIYMIISALGFAALENILVLAGLGPAFMLAETVSLSIFRFLTATFLHTLCSAIIGYFLAISFFETKNRVKLLFLGIVISTCLHGLYNFYIIKNEGNCNFQILFSVLVSLAIFVTLAMKKLHKMKNVCKVN